MTIREIRSDMQTIFLGKPTHRTRPEQFVGLGIYLTISLGFWMISGLATQFLALPYTLFLTLGMWVLWRRYSLRVLKLELSLFLAQFLFQIVWSVSFFILEQSLLVLVSLLLLSCTTLMATLLFWKKEKFSGILYLFPLLWVFHLAFTNMIHCISNP